MPNSDFGSLVLNARRAGRQRALQEALTVPWQQLAEAAAAFAEWHMIVLWVRVITETADQLPEIVRSALQSRCPGFLESWSREENDISHIWKSLEEWVTAHWFAEASAQGWFGALMYYAYKDLRIEQAWTTWERTKAEWRHMMPAIWPTLDQWTSEVVATRSLACHGTDKARAVEALGKVEAIRLNNAVSDLLETRALALWIDSVSRPGQALNEAVTAELRSRCPGLVFPRGVEAHWVRALLLRLLRLGDSTWRGTAKSEGWNAALRYAVLHHPRYQRLIHYNKRCHDEWSQVPPKCYPLFANWISATDTYCAPQRK